MALLTLLAVCVSAPVAYGVTRQKSDKNLFIFDHYKLRSSLDLNVIDAVEQVQMTQKVLRTRLLNAKKDVRVEPVQIPLPADSTSLQALSQKLAAPGKAKQLFDYFQKLYQSSSAKMGKDQTKKVNLDAQAVKFLALAELSKFLTKPHHNVEVITAELREDPALRKQLFKQVNGFLSATQKEELARKIKMSSNLDLEKDLLPAFAKRMVRKYLVFRGPNCFHASLAFHGKDFSNSKYINVKLEDGYHNSMINYDELWRAILGSFYEINPEENTLQYGDLLVFFDLPKDYSVTNFRWIRHAATYLFGPYTFSKGSKSPDTPYTVKTLDEEWQTWKKYVSNLGIKVFRRKPGPLPTTKPPVDLVDWVF